MPAQFSLPDIVRPALALTADTVAAGRHRDSWDGEAVATFGSRFRDVGDLLPTFRREPLTAPPPRVSGPGPVGPEHVGPELRFGASQSFPPNPHLDLIVRNPDRFLPVPVPVGVVSRRYELIQHRDGMKAVARALAAWRIAPDDLPVEVTITEFGRHLACSVRLPEAFDFVEADRTRMALTIECFNSVDGSSAFRVLAGWFRFVCSNGLIVGNCKVDFRRRHTPSLRLDQVESALERGVRAADLERQRFGRWQHVKVAWPRLVGWAETALAEKWGVVAAARTLHIARTGRDARVATTSWRGPLAERPMIAGADVAGCAPPADTLYKLSQVLAWLAGQTAEVGRRMERRSQVVRLMRRLAHA